MTIKGYVVRGQDRQLKGAQVWATADGVSMRRERAKLYGDVDAAVGAWAELRRCSWCAGARILAVHADGTETPLPTYEEALAEIDAVQRAIPEEHRGYTSLHLSIAAMLGERDAFERCAATWRTTADQYCNTIAERDAEIGRLRTLLAKVFGGEANEASLGQLVELAAAELTAIDHAVAEAGIDTCGPDDTLPARAGRLIEDANERAEHAESIDDVLARIVAAWRDDEIGQIDGALIEEAEALLGITPEADPLAEEPAS